MTATTVSTRIRGSQRVAFLRGRRSWRLQSSWSRGTLSRPRGSGPRPPRSPGPRPPRPARPRLSGAGGGRRSRIGRRAQGRATGAAVVEFVARDEAGQERVVALALLPVAVAALAVAALAVAAAVRRAAACRAGRSRRPGGPRRCRTGPAAARCPDSARGLGTARGLADCPGLELPGLLVVVAAARPGPAADSRGRPAGRSPGDRSQRRRSYRAPGRRNRGRRSPGRRNRAERRSRCRPARPSRPADGLRPAAVAWGGPGRRRGRGRP